MSKSTFNRDAADEFHHPVEVVPLVAGVAPHGVGGIAGVQVLDAQRHALLLRVAEDLLDPGRAVLEGVVEADLAARGVRRLHPLHADEADHARELLLGAGVDGFLRLRHEFVAMGGVVEAASEAHAIGSHGTHEAVLL
jgi:hypothetical protein